ncbi:tRNA cytosine(34) acetyltransferase TmcA [Vibrio diazotrophicus]|uniref:tRNA(Met) cytidine acetyltransferase TmcA n=1 Tax=Vibrio diazotrophicus TaxID=685 RepID=A0A2J8I7M1_VIBDI|nr:MULTISPECIES: GNAT family N-acetyltransferase [Vibrio]MCF7362372.1 GNAT family N-acetyltransferase [Vibrio sp. A1-b2]PNI06513.1 tRNA cytosine(34) acetyltransferase TmcA [Vibrio diazotrophicus]
MSSETTQFVSYLFSLRQLALKHQFRFGVFLQGSQEWNYSLIQHWLKDSNSNTAFQVGGDAFDGVRYVPFNKGQQLLGQECDLLICDLSTGWDANSFSAALGTLIGGGILLVLGANTVSANPAEVWLKRALDNLIVMSPDILPSLPSVSSEAHKIDYSQQQLAVDNIVKVVTGHRKRPLILTADRGRGKSSALGMAAAKLMSERNIRIVVTAPSLASVSPVFHFAQKLLVGSSGQKGLVEYEHSILRFIAPDELLRSRLDCDLLLVDEAAALPLPMLKEMVSCYHRAVFSSTIHGYEGCGRGFSLKFQSWLKDVRPEMKLQNMTQPIRWSQGDPLEAWHRESFLLDFDFQPISVEVSVDALQFSWVTKTNLLDDPALLHSIFSLLVNAHYQTSPSDLFHLLGDEKMSVYIATHHDVLVGCILSVEEGALDKALIEDIQLGKRRPKGHLSPITIANQLGIAEAAVAKSQRIMRIAVHPDVQNKNIGYELVKHFALQNACDYLSTSFGASSALVNFWRKCGFQTIKVGSLRDQASGCYSVLMVKGENVDWLKLAKQKHAQHFDFELSDSLQAMEPNLVKTLLSENLCSDTRPPIALVHNYALGGSNYESAAVWLRSFALSIGEEQVNTLSDLFVSKVVQRLSWKECAERHQLTGRKQVETNIRKELLILIDDLQCKPGW